MSEPSQSQRDELGIPEEANEDRTTSKRQGLNNSNEVKKMKFSLESDLARASARILEGTPQSLKLVDGRSYPFRN